MRTLVKVGFIAAAILVAMVGTAWIAALRSPVRGSAEASAAMASMSTDELLTKASAGELLHLTDANFERTLAAAKAPVLVDFWAPWCGPCRALAPTIDALAAELKGRWMVVKVNVDEAPRVAQQHGVSSIPTLVAFHDGKPTDRLVGLVPRETIIDRLIETK